MVVAPLPRFAATDWEGSVIDLAVTVVSVALAAGARVRPTLRLTREKSTPTPATARRFFLGLLAPPALVLPVPPPPPPAAALRDRGIAVYVLD